MTTLDAAGLRAPLGVRAFLGLLGVSALAFTVALMLSDRAPGVTQQLFGDFAERLSDRLDASSTVDTARLPDNDAIVHIGLWGVATLLVALTVWRWWGLVLCGAAVFVASVFVEIGQGRYSTTRSVESSDIMANAAGVAAGTLVAAACMLLWAAVSAGVQMVRARRP
ncbi:hypothetical protein [Ilumatobacter nonamiensis]|uniref:hypothetical protein n=1 Tax=Ilumatobacter nonamiensis TaxID=467093 RepID=UPI000348AC8E|nr:hypothetical protein [Ilumatobacter nonamiensis]